MKVCTNQVTGIRNNLVEGTSDQINELGPNYRELLKKCLLFHIMIHNMK